MADKSRCTLGSRSKNTTGSTDFCINTTDLIIRPTLAILREIVSAMLNRRTIISKTSHSTRNSSTGHCTRRSCKTITGRTISRCSSIRRCISGSRCNRCTSRRNDTLTTSTLTIFTHNLNPMQSVQARQRPMCIFIFFLTARIWVIDNNITLIVDSCCKNTMTTRATVSIMEYFTRSICTIKHDRFASFKCCSKLISNSRWISSRCRCCIRRKSLDIDSQSTKVRTMRITITIGTIERTRINRLTKQVRCTHSSRSHYTASIIDGRIITTKALIRPALAILRKIIRTILNRSTIIFQLRSSTRSASFIGTDIGSSILSIFPLSRILLYASIKTICRSSLFTDTRFILSRILLDSSIQSISRSSTNDCRVDLARIKITRNFTSLRILPIVCAISILASNINPVSILTTTTNVTQDCYILTRVKSRIHRIHITQLSRRTSNTTDSIHHILRSHAALRTMTSRCIIGRFTRHTQHICHSCNATTAISDIISVTHREIGNIRIILRYHRTMTNSLRSFTNSTSHCTRSSCESNSTITRYILICIGFSSIYSIFLKISITVISSKEIKELTAKSSILLIIISFSAYISTILCIICINFIFEFLLMLFKLIFLFSITTNANIAK